MDYYGILGCDELSSVSFVHLVNYFAAGSDGYFSASRKNLLNCAKVNGSSWSVKSDAVAYSNYL